MSLTRPGDAYRTSEIGAYCFLWPTIAKQRQKFRVNSPYDSSECCER